MVISEIKYDWTEDGVKQETSRCYTEHLWCFQGIVFFPESSLKAGHVCLANCLSKLSIIALLFVTTTSGMDFVTAP